MWRTLFVRGASPWVQVVLAAIVMELAFGALGWIPARRPDVRAAMTHVAFDYTLWLNIAFGALALGLFVYARRRPVQHAHCAHHGHAHR